MSRQAKTRNQTTATRTQDIEVWDGDVRTRALIGGDGPPLLYLHAALGLKWDRFCDSLAEHHTVYAPYLPGTAPGEPDAIKAIDDVWDLTLCYEEILDALGLTDPVPVVGHSIGGMIALELAANSPARVSKLVLICPVGLWREDLGWNNPMLMDFVQLGEAAFADPDGPVAQDTLAMPEEQEALDEKIIEVTWAMGCAGQYIWPLPDRGLRKRIHRVQAPALVIWGEADRIVPAGYAEEFVRLMPNARAEVLTDAAHVPQLEQFDLVAPMVEKFLA